MWSGDQDGTITIFLEWHCIIQDTTTVDDTLQVCLDVDRLGNVLLELAHSHLEGIWETWELVISGQDTCDSLERGERIPLEHPVGIYLGDGMTGLNSDGLYPGMG